MKRYTVYWRSHVEDPWEWIGGSATLEQAREVVDEHIEWCQEEVGPELHCRYEIIPENPEPEEVWLATIPAREEE